MSNIPTCPDCGKSGDNVWMQSVIQRATTHLGMPQQYHVRRPQYYCMSCKIFFRLCSTCEGTGDCGGAVDISDHIPCPNCTNGYELV